MGKAGNHHPQQTDTRTENQTLLTHKWVLSNENTWSQGGEHHTLEPFEAGGRLGEPSVQ